LFAGAPGINAGPLPGTAGQQRYPRPRGPGPSSMQGSGNVGLQGHGGPGLGQGNQGGGAAWPGSGNYYPRASRYPQPVNNQSLPGQALAHYPQQQPHMSMGAPVGAYHARLMAGMQGGGHPGASVDQLSKTNLYIRGLPATTTDRDLYNTCCV
jgi:hypothetical protein